MSHIQKCSKCNKNIVCDDAIIITKTDFEGLLNSAKKDQDEFKIPRIRTISNSPIGRNKEIANFIIEKYKTMLIIDIYHEAKKTFGKNAPSRAAIYRYLKEMRRKGGI